MFPTIDKKSCFKCRWMIWCVEIDGAKNADTQKIIEILSDKGVYVGAKKICGILIENSIRSNRIVWSIIGIGININQTVFPSHLPNPTSLLLEKAIGPNQRASEAKRQAHAPDHKTQHEPELDLSQLLAQFHEIYSEYYYCYLSSRNHRENTRKSNLEALDQLFRSKLL